MKKLFTYLTIIATIISFTIAFPNFSVDASNQTNQGEMLKEMDKFEKIEDEDVTKDLKDRVKDNSDKLKVDNKILDYENAEARSVKDSDIKVVTVPVTDGDNYNEISNISVYFNDNGEIEHYSELYVSKSDEGTFEVELLLDGEVETHEVTSEEFTTAEDYQASQDDDSAGIQPAGVDWDAFLKCMGITGVAASVISSACGLACALTAGTACVACAAGVLGFNSGSISGCLAGSWT